MAESYPLELALFDFLPNLAFLTGAFFLTKIISLAQGKSYARLAAAGGLLIFLGGFLKATWKLLYTLQIADLQPLSDAQFVLLAPGFLTLLILVIRLARAARVPIPQVALALAPWKIPFLAVMTLCSIGTEGILCYLSFQRGARPAAWAFIVAVLCLFAMSGMASGGNQSAAAQWTAEVINTVGQSAFAIGCWLLYKDYRRAIGV